MREMTSLQIVVIIRKSYEQVEKEVAPHSSVLTWEIPWTEEPGVLWSMGSQRVGHNLAA